MKKNILVKISAFIAIFAVLYLIIFDALYVREPGSATIVGGFYEQKENTNDVVYIGSSVVFSGFNSTMAYHLNGFTTYDFSSGSQPLSAAKYIIKEAQKTQNPKLYIIELRDAGNETIANSAAVQRLTAYMPQSLNRSEMISDMIDMLPEQDTSKFWDYFFVYPYFHNRWANLSLTDFFRAKRSSEVGSDDSVYKGYRNKYYDLKNWQNEPAYNPDVFATEPKKMPEKQEEALKELLEYCKTLDAEVLFVYSPVLVWEDYAAKMNYASDLVSSYGFDCLNTNLYMEDMGIVVDEDFYEGTHLNNFGAAKYTQYLSAYLAEHYDLPDHRSETEYASWETEYKAERLKTLQNTALLYQYLRLLMRSEYSGIVLWSDLRHLEKESIVLQEFLPNLDIEQSDGQQLAVWIEDGNVQDYQLGDTAEIVTNQCVGSATVSGCNVTFNGATCSCNESGVLCVVYDAETTEVLDTTAFYMDWNRDLMSANADSMARNPSVKDELAAGWTEESALQMIGRIDSNIIESFGFIPGAEDIYTSCLIALTDMDCTGQTVYMEFENSKGQYRGYELLPMERADWAEMMKSDLYLNGGAGINISYEDLPAGTYTVRLFREKDGKILYSNRTWKAEYSLSEWLSRIANRVKNMEEGGTDKS